MSYTVYDTKLKVISALIESLAQYAAATDLVPRDSSQVDWLALCQLKRQLRIRPTSSLAAIKHVFDCLFQPKPTVGSIREPTDLKASASAFDKAPFLNSTGYVGLFARTVACYASRWKSDSSYYAPMTSVINASMVGKSRMLSEVSAMGVFCFLMCLRSQPEREFRPPRTAEVADLLAAELPSSAGGTEAFERKCHDLFLRLLEKLAIWLETQCRVLDDSKGEKRLKELTMAWFEHTQSNAVQFWEGSTTPVPATAGLTWEKVEERIQTRLSALVKPETWKNDKQLHLLFIVDEARAMVKAKTFVPFRRSTRTFPKGPGTLNAFCVVTDTTSKVANFNPAKELEESERASMVGTNTFAPFTLVQALDSWWISARDVRIDSAPGDDAAVLKALKTALMKEPTAGGAADGKRFQELLTLSLLEKTEVMAFFGRPAFYGFYHFNAQLTTDPRKALLKLLKLKLLKTNPEYIQAKLVPLSLAAAMAVLGSIVSLEVSAASELASEIASGHMRLVAAISIDRHLVYTMEISEPAMAKAVHQLIMTGVVTWKELLDKFLASELNNSTMVGFRGEVAAQILLLIAWQKCLKDMTPAAAEEFPAVPVLTFLRALLGDDFQVSQEMKKTLSGGYVRLEQFVKTFVEISDDMLYEYFIRGSGVYCREGQKAIDAVIGIFYPDLEAHADYRKAPVSKERIRPLMFQIRLRKRYESCASKENWDNKLAELPLQRGPGREQLPSVAVFLELGKGVSKRGEPAEKAARLDRVELAEWPSGSVGLSVFVRGLSVTDIDPDLKEADAAFKRLLESLIDPSDTATVDAGIQPEIRRMFATQPYMGTVPVRAEDLTAPVVVQQL